MNTNNTDPFEGVPDMADYVILQFHHVDDFRCFRPLEDAIPDFSGPFTEPDKQQASLMLTELRRRLAESFTEEGWEGDGEIEVSFIPPFLCEAGDTTCTAIFHVKQANNGTSFIAVRRGVEYRNPRQE